MWRNDDIDTIYGDEEMTKSYYDTMQVCLKGHKITACYDSSPEVRTNFCKKCGERTIYQCQNCSEKIRGFYNTTGIINLHEIPIPSNCHNCGKSFPWKNKSIKIEKKDILNKNTVIENIFAKI